MKQKTILLIIVSLTLILPLTAVETNSLTNVVTISQSPGEVYFSETVTISVDISGMVRDEEILSARISYSFNDAIQPSIYPTESIPTRESILTFSFGPFAAEDIIRYKIYLEFREADDYQSDWEQFTVQGGSRPLLTADQLTIIIIASIALLALAVFVIYKLKNR